jgi:hypothetical protein
MLKYERTNLALSRKETVSPTRRDCLGIIARVAPLAAFSPTSLWADPSEPLVPQDSAVQDLTRSTVVNAIENTPVRVTLNDAGAQFWGNIFTGQGKATFNVRNVIIDGLSFPKFTWQWIGMSIASGVLAGLGGMLFGLLTEGLRSNNQDLENLLKRQLEEFARIVETKLQENDLRNYTAAIESYLQIFDEYKNNRTTGRKDYLLNETATELSKIKSLGFIGYRTYITGAGLRLSLLQELMKHDRREVANFVSQRDRINHYQKDANDTIDRATDAAAVLNGAWEDIFGEAQAWTFPPPDYPRLFRVERDILGVQARGYVWIHRRQMKEMTDAEVNYFSRLGDSLRLMNYLPPNRVSLSEIRTKLKNETTVLGDKAIQTVNRVRLPHTAKLPA